MQNGLRDARAYYLIPAFQISSSIGQGFNLALNSTFRKLRSWHLVPSLQGKLDGETMETVTDFIFLGSQITADGHCSHEITRHFLLRRKAMTNQDSILKSRDITLPTKVCIVKTKISPVVMYGFESWAIKKVECRRIDAFELCSPVLEKTLDSPLDCEEIQLVHPKGNQSWVFIGGTDAEAEAPILWPFFLM